MTKMKPYIQKFIDEILSYDGETDDGYGIWTVVETAETVIFKNHVHDGDDINRYYFTIEISKYALQSYDCEVIGGDYNLVFVNMLDGDELRAMKHNVGESFYYSITESQSPYYINGWD